MSAKSNNLYLPHPLYPPLLEKERGREEKEGLMPLLNTLLKFFRGTNKYNRRCSS
jgi:hypothetical protein